MPRAFRAPFPFDVVINRVGYMLGSPAKGKPPSIVGSKPPDLAQQLPSELGYDAQSPLVSRTQSYDDLSGGFGQEIQLKEHDRRYHYALNVDYSGGTFGVLGPRLFAQRWPRQGETATDVTDFFEIDGVLFACNGHWIQKRVDDSRTGWSGALDLGTGTVTTATVLYNAGNGENTAYLALGISDFFWKFNGTAGTKHGSLYAQDFALTGLEFWRAILPNELEKCDVDADPFDPANWTDNGGVTYTVGDKASAIGSLATTIGGTLLALKTDGVYTLDALGDSENLYPHLQFAPAATNGAHGDWLNDLYVTYGNGSYRITPQPVLGSSNLHLPLAQIGPERVVDNTSEVKGTITAYAGHDSFCLYAALYNTDTGDSYLLKFGQWIEGPDGTPQRAEVWHGSITKAFVGKKITALHVTSVGTIADHKRLYLGFSDSTVQWFTLPCTPNPVNCTAYLFSQDEGTLRLPWAHLMFRNNTKVLRDITLSGMNLATSDYAKVKVATSPDAPFQFLVDSNGDAYAFTTTPLQTIPLGTGSFNYQTAALATFNGMTLLEMEGLRLVDMENTTGLSGGYDGRYLGLEITLGATDHGTSPRLIGAGFSYMVRLPINKVYSFDLLTDSGLTKRDGTPLRATARTLKDAIEAAAAQSLPVPATLPDQTQTTLAIGTGLRETTLWSDRLRGWFGGIHVDAVEQPIPAAPAAAFYGTLRRLSQYTLAELEAMTLSQMEAI